MLLTIDVYVGSLFRPTIFARKLEASLQLNLYYLILLRHDERIQSNQVNKDLTLQVVRCSLKESTQQRSSIHSIAAAGRKNVGPAKILGYELSCQPRPRV